MLRVRGSPQQREGQENGPWDRSPGQHDVKAFCFINSMLMAGIEPGHKAEQVQGIRLLSHGHVGDSTVEQDAH